MLRILTAYLLMTSSDSNDVFVPAQEKFEWVTPQISLMGVEDTEGKPFTKTGEDGAFFGPS